MSAERPSPYLSSQDLHALTGTPQKARQAIWLRQHRWRFELDFADRPRVARAYHDRRLVGIESAEPPKATTGPDWAALGI